MSSQRSVKYKLWLHHFAEVKEFFQILRTDTDWSQLHDSRDWLLNSSNPMHIHYTKTPHRVDIIHKWIAPPQNWVSGRAGTEGFHSWIPGLTHHGMHKSMVSSLIINFITYLGELYSCLIAAVTNYHNLVAQTTQFIILQFLRSSKWVSLEWIQSITGLNSFWMLWICLILLLEVTCILGSRATSPHFKPSVEPDPSHKACSLVLSLDLVFCHDCIRSTQII